MTEIIGITGGIGTGKSTVSKYLKNKGFTVIDADEMAREVSEKEEVIKEIENTFGKEFIEDGKMNREKIAEKVFSDPKSKIKLEEIITSRIIQESKKIFEEYRNSDLEKLVFFDAPTLIESGAANFMDRILLVTAAVDTRLIRISERDKCDNSTILKRMDNQMPDEEKKKFADFIIDNSSDIKTLYEKMEDFLHEAMNT